MSTVEEFVRHMKAIADSTTVEDQAAFEEWLQNLPKAPERPEQETAVILIRGKKQG